MKRFRLPVLVAGGVVFLLLVAVVIAFSSAFQTWMVRRAIAAEPGLKAGVGSVSAGLKRVHLTDLRLEHTGAVLTLPHVEIDLPVFSAAWSKNASISRLVARDWTLDLTRSGAPAVLASQPAGASVAPGASGAATLPSIPPEAVEATQRHFAGVFSQLQLPIDVAVDGLLLEGEIVLPAARGRTQVTMKGGGFGAGREGRLELNANAALTDGKVSQLAVHGSLTATMDTPRSFTNFALTLNATANGTQFPKGVTLRADLNAAKAPSGETYSAAVVTEGREILNVTAGLPLNAEKVDGVWKLDVRDAQVAPFTLGQPLPSFAATGEGRFDADVRLGATRISGRFNATLDRLEAVMPQLAVVGPTTIAADFDLAERAGTFGVRKFEATLKNDQPVLTVRTLQPFDFNSGTRELHTANDSLDLFGLTLHAVPVAWAKSFVDGVELSGGHVRGELAATARGGGVAVHATSPLRIDGVTIAQTGKTLLAEIDFEVNPSIDYTPRGWQAEINGFRARRGEVVLASLDAKAGQLAGTDQPIKATGKLSANLPALFAQPFAAGTVALTSGDAAVEFVVSANEKQEIQANVGLNNLTTTIATAAAPETLTLPAITSSLRADISADGKITFNAPIVLQREDRQSDLALVGTLSAEKNQTRAIDAEVTSTRLILNDAHVLTAIFPTTEPATSTPDTTPPWAGVNGSVAVKLKQVIYSDAFQMLNVAGRLQIDAGMVKLEGLQAGLSSGGNATLSGRIAFDGAAPRPYSLAADLALKEFDPGPLFHVLNTDQPPTLEGKFDITSRLQGTAPKLDQLSAAAEGDFQITSKGGVFRGLPVSVSTITETTNKWIAWITSAGTAAIGVVTGGKKDYADVANKAEAVTELARSLNPISYDQLSVVLTRDAALNTTLKEFTLISPELRLTGSGTALHKSGAGGFLDDSLVMEFTLRARGRQSELLKYLGALETETDDLGYATCTMPLKVSGTLSRPDTSELNSKLTALAIEKSGFGDKAAEFFAKIRGK